MLVIGIMGIVVVLMAIQFKSIKPEYGIMISVVGCAFIFLYSLVRVNEIVEMVERLAGITSVSREYIKIILKITGVTFISEIASDIAKDCGYQAVANQVQIFGKLSVFLQSLHIRQKIYLLVQIRTMAMASWWAIVLPWETGCCLKCGSHTRLPPFLRQFLSGCL